MSDRVISYHIMMLMTCDDRFGCVCMALHNIHNHFERGGGTETEKRREGEREGGRKEKRDKERKSERERARERVWGGP